MLRKCLLLLAAALLLFTLAGAEEEENLFLGTWEIAYWIQDGRLVTPEEDSPTMIVFEDDTLTVHYPEGEPHQTDCIYNGNLCKAWKELTIFTLEDEKLIIGYENGASFILTRIDPMVLNNPFIGTWTVLCGKMDGSVYPASDLAADAVVIFTADAIQLVTNEETQTFACTYADGVCSIDDAGETQALCVIREDGLLRLYSPEDDSMEILCARENEVIPEDISRFYGQWREIAVLQRGVLVTDQTAPAQRPEGSPSLFQYRFDRAATARTCPEQALYTPVWMLCTYQDGVCTIDFDGAYYHCTIDASGMMCMRTEDGQRCSWLICVENEPPVPIE